ncbi:beta-N-acetylglucosaminidase [Oceanobacillus iheyensis HTE831]|uniref:beta-N-acetylhexosaminidase n=1 Tax=Oceanobacillus iheyensis (strain DSM 14371 / CIP 107618 / JCM 11309 / KCTC 3954 / HTE831) TaxID=221109 RepID=Q8ERK3_OCEIH|nr:glycoside hydrolase family 3 protein [Oceanobacillus iheyensis]BAC13255.1 beta-N-acetylglucosaminidase [Oceanobacillus iheyensis HTE831]
MVRKFFLLFLSIVLTFTTLPMTAFAEEEDEIQTMINNMSVEEKVGQLFIVHVYGQTPTDPNYESTNLTNNRGGKNFQEVIENYHIGGIIYFNWSQNIGTPLEKQQVHDLSNGLQDIALEQDSEIPLFVSTDQEGGIVQRVISPGTVFPGNMAIGATNSIDFASRSGEILGKELDALGINMNFAPTVDVNLNPANPVIGVRSFGEDPDMVSQLGAAQITAYEDQDVVATAKHFPGHGDTDVDSHYGLPVIDHDLETLHEVDLPPFQAAIDAGVGAIMTGHIVVPALDDSGMPATLSYPILTELLREDMGFEGLIITDSLGMSGANVVPPERVAVESFLAGADILLNPPDVPVAYEGVMDAVESGEISEERLDESVYRILSAKMEYGLFEDPYTESNKLDVIGSESHLKTASEIAEKSITLLKNNGDVLPLQEDEEVFITGPQAAYPNKIANLLGEQDIQSTHYSTATSPTDNQIAEAVDRAESADKVVVTTYTANTNERQQMLVEALQELDKPIVVSAHRNPYDLMAFPNVDAYLNSYSYLDVSLDAVAASLIGDINPSGKLPVTIPDVNEIGDGVDYVGAESANDIKSLVDELHTNEELNSDEAKKAFERHLTAVAQFEKTNQSAKVIKHLESFQTLIDHYNEQEALSKKAFNYLETTSLRLIDQWED